LTLAHRFAARRGAKAAIIVYDITSPESFARAKNWVRELQRQGNPEMIMALAGEQRHDLVQCVGSFICFVASINLLKPVLLWGEGWQLKRPCNACLPE